MCVSVCECECVCECVCACCTFFGSCFVRSEKGRKMKKLCENEKQTTALQTDEEKRAFEKERDRN